MELIIISFGYFIQIYSYIMLAYVLIGYFPDARDSKIYDILSRLCEPLINLFSFATISGISFAPIVAMLFLQLIYRLLIVIYM